MKNSLKYYFGTAWLATLLSACSYDVTLNERLVYSPAPLLKVEQVADNALKNCLQQAIIDQQARALLDIRQLSCSNAGIRSLAGLDRFRAIEELNLKNNQIHDLAPLASLRSLRTLLLNDNAIASLTPLGLLDTLQTLNLEGNKDLDCKSLQTISAVFADAEINAPLHCQS